MLLPVLLSCDESIETIVAVFAAIGHGWTGGYGDDCLFGGLDVQLVLPTQTGLIKSSGFTHFDKASLRRVLKTWGNRMSRIMRPIVSDYGLGG